VTGTRFRTSGTSPIPRNAMADLVSVISPNLFFLDEGYFSRTQARPKGILQLNVFTLECH
jgi:hypothetical protein